MAMDEIIQGDCRTKREESPGTGDTRLMKGRPLKAFSSNSKSQGRTRDMGYH